MMIFDIDKKHNNTTAIIDADGYSMTYGQIEEFCDDFYAPIGRRTLIFIICEQNTAALAGYIAALNNRIVPLLISSNTDIDVLVRLIELYHPEFIWVPENWSGNLDFEHIYHAFNYKMLRTNLSPYEMHEDLSLLLTTSGSTGSPKFVRHSYRNVESNAANVAHVFELDNKEKAMVSLPIQFTQGLNVASSHLLAGATILLSRYNFMNKEFWSFFKENEATSLTGVPYSIELLDRLRFFRMDLPHFRTLNQGGGRLSDSLFMKCAEYAHQTGRRFIATYGATETTARMAYLPPEKALYKCGSIGYAITNGRMDLVNDDGKLIEDSDEIGEIIYHGPNVTMGYALSGEDLAKADERQGVYHTGDLAFRDKDGCHFIVGRKARFLKLFGIRISLDETERLIKDKYSMECACTGTDKQMKIFITATRVEKEVLNYVAEKTSINKTAFEVICIEKIPKNDAGKTMYNQLNAWSKQ